MRIAILGCGSIGCRHLQNLLELGCTDLLAFDPSMDARQIAKRKFDVPTFGNLNEVWIQKPNIAMITAPSNLHQELALAAARLGCHLFIEKPLSYTLDGVDELLCEIEKRKLISMVGCNMRFHPGPVKVKELVDKGSIGRVIASRLQTGSYLPNWRPWQDYRQSYSASPEWGGVVLDCIHEIDLALWYFGSAELVASACLPANNIELETDGMAEIILRHRSGVLSSLHLNFIQRDYCRICQIIGSSGTIYWNFNKHQVDVYGSDGQLCQSFTEPENWTLNNMYIDELKHFLKAVQKGKQTVNPVVHGMTTLKIALTARIRGKSL